ncbi:hypothetical protein [Legionella brunensis]|uniref:Uncharacterized protein n=1 Tax=Legionella brunensis TaxID=29422 RepID=A0A0W0SP29_9GAMM|nr:hypothetical protein [Legionella brunensis]KTC85115.1 hypothetical protein Lbru_0911 [Legionella brunensis]
MHGKFEEGSLINKENNASRPNLAELRQKFLTYRVQESGFFKFNSKNKIEQLKNEPNQLIVLYKEMIITVNQQNLFYQGLLKEVEQYGEDGESLKELINLELARQQKFIKEIESQLSAANILISLLALSHDELLAEAKRNKSSALFITRIPQLIAKISNSEIKDITHQDEEIVKSLASILVSREYTFETAQIFTFLKQQVETPFGKQFIIDQENQSIRTLLLKIDNYLNQKIEQALKGKNDPWSLGYFGSRYKLNKDGKQVSIPHGIHELKAHLALLDKISPSQILERMQETLHMKLNDIHDESIFTQFKRLVSYIFGCHRSEDMIQEYEFLDDVLSGKKPVSGL